MTSKLSIRGKQLVILCPRAYVKYVSLIYHDSRSSATRLTSAMDHISVQWERKKDFSRHISVVYISVRLIISATWVRQIPLSLDIETSSNIESKANLENRGTDDSYLHENMFVFDKAFAQEIKYLFAELDFDLYMCQEKQGGMKKRQMVSRRIPFWRPKEQHQTFVYFVRQNDRGGGIFSNGRGTNVREYIEQVRLDQVLEAFNDDMKSDGKNLPIYKEELPRDITVEDYLLQFEKKDVNLKSLPEDESGRQDVSVEEYLKLCEEERDSSVEEYLKLFERGRLPSDLTVEEYLRLCEEEKINKDITVEEYLLLCKEKELSQGITVEEYLRRCEEDIESKDLTIEEYLRLCEEERLKEDISVDEYLRLFERKLSPDMTVEEYLRMFKKDRSHYEMTVEDYLKLHEGKSVSKDMTVEEYIALCRKEGQIEDMTVERYLELCDREKRSRDMTVEEYLKLCEEEKLSRDITVEEYLKLCEEEKLSKDLTVEEYLKLCEEEKLSRDMTVEEYLKLCEEEKLSRDMTVEEYLKLCEEEKLSRDMTVEEYLKLCEEEKLSKDVTVEEYLKLCKEEKLSRDMTVEEYLKLCEEEKLAEDVTVEEYLKLCEEEKLSRDVTVEEYLKLCEEEKLSRDVTVEEYLSLCEQDQRKKDITVEEYLRLCEEEKEASDLTIEEYLRECELEQRADLSVEEYLLQFRQEDTEIWDAFKNKLFADFRPACSEYNVSEEVLYKENVPREVKDHGSVISSKEDNFGYVGSLSLQKISLDHDLDELGNSAVERQPCTRFQVETDEEEITESVVAQAESSVDDWMIFDTLDIDNKEHSYEKSVVEEDFFHKVFFSQSDEDGMGAVLQRHGLIYSAELWLIFPPYRRTPWINISVMYQDDVIFEWGISRVVEAEIDETISADDSEMKAVFEEETVDYLSVESSRCHVVEEDELLATKVGVNYSEIEFSFVEILDDKYTNNNNTLEYVDSCSNGHEKGMEHQGVVTNRTKKRAHQTLKQAQPHPSDEQLNTAGNFHFTPLTHSTKKGLVYRSKERIFTGSEAESRSVWNNLEKLQCKHAKAINVPESLRRTVSKNSLDILEATVENEDNRRSKQDIDNEATSAFVTSPLKIETFGKNLRESNV